jgi:cyanophycin synthetase
MKVQKTLVLKGPNYWSATHHNLIVLNLTNSNDSVTQPPVFSAEDCTVTAILSQLQPYINAATENLFLKAQVDEQSRIQLVAPVALALQAKAGMMCTFSAIKSYQQLEQHTVVFEYVDEEAGRFAANAAVALVQALGSATVYDIEKDVEQLKAIWEGNRMGPSTYSVVQEAISRNIPCIRLDDAFVQLGYGVKQKRIEATIASTTSCIAVDVASDKQRTKALLTQALIPVPEGVILQTVENLSVAVEEVGFPIVIKPLNGNQGKGATTGITTLEEAIEAFYHAQVFSKKIIVEKFVEGIDFRALVINYKFVAAAKRTPAAVMGDGIHTIQQLVDKVNSDPRRGNGHCNMLTQITIDGATQEILTKKGYSLQTVLPNGEELWLKSTANLSTGGTAEDVTDKVQSCNIHLFERIARQMGLDICGIDIIAPDLLTPIAENGGTVIEVNAAPGFRMHLEPTIGIPRNVAAPVMDMLFPYKDDGRIPIIAVTGTNGKTTTTRLIAQMATQSGFTTGFTTTDGIYLDKQRIYKGDCSGPASAQVVLKDSATEFAVLECARGGILRTGLGFDQCNCAVITNIAADHLGLNGINTLEELAHVKAVVAKSVSENGYVILNADDDLVYAMRETVKGKIALFSMYYDSYRIQKHCESGGIAAYPEDGYIIIREGNHIRPIEELENIPLTYGGKAEFNVANVLGAVLAGYVSKLAMPAIRSTLRNFKNSLEQTPGRMNFIEFDNFTMVLDYAHNTHGVKAIGKFINTIPASKKIGVITAVGDRRNEDIIALGEAAAPLFDELIIRHDDDLRGRTALEIRVLLQQGIQKATPGKTVFYSTSEAEAIDKSIALATPQSLIVFLVDNIDGITKKVMELKQKGQRKFEEIRMAI